MRLYEPVHLYLFELVNALYAARVSARRRLFAPKAGRMRHIAQRQRPRRQYFAAVHIRYRHLSGGQQPQVVFVVAVHRVGELRQVAVRGRRFGGDYIRQVEFLIAVFLRVGVQHPVYQRSLQPRALAFQHEKARTRHTRAALKVDDAQPFPDFPVRFWRKIKLRRIAHHARNYIIALISARRHIVGRYVRQAEQQRVKVSVQAANSLFELAHTAAYLPHFVD